MVPRAKLDLALRIEALGVDAVETGFPASSPAEAEATRLISQALTTARFTTFCRAVRQDVTVAVQSGGTARHEVQVLATASDLHLQRKRRITRKEAVGEVIDTVSYAVATGVESVSVGLEDASRGEDELLRSLVEAGVGAGATSVAVGDTSGCLTPGQYGELIAKIREWAPAEVKIATHCHNDFGLAMANTLAGLQAGADGAQVTLGGIGERAGNAAMEELIALLTYKSDELGLRTEVDPKGMYAAYGKLRQVIHLEEPRNKAIFGRYAFGSAAGIHQQGMLRDPATYEFVEPSKFGRERSILIARHSGRSVLRHLLDQFDIDLAEERVDELYRVHITDRPGGDCEDMSVLKERLAEELFATKSA